jgi:cob(I)alamin adenosyltransferase
MKIYTRTGDGGKTGLFGGGRVSKSHVRVEAYGAVDELNAGLGLCVEAIVDGEIRGWLGRIQNDLFSLGASLASSVAENRGKSPTIPPLPEDRLVEMEGWIDLATEEVPELRNFILPGGTRGAACLHLARTICRRAERAVVRLSEGDESDPVVIKYLNRLSDLLFALARLENARQGVPDVIWDKNPG